jgi:hypothetical protein
MPNETQVTEPASGVGSEPPDSAGAVTERPGRPTPAPGGGGVDDLAVARLPNGTPTAVVEHHEVKRDVRAPQPRLLSALARAHAIGRLSRLV